MQATLGLAIEDFVPVLVSLFAYICISRSLMKINRQCGWTANIGLILVVLGGLLKAGSKLNSVFTGYEIPWMEDSLFHLMAPGFFFMAWSVWNVQRIEIKNRKPVLIWQVPTIFLSFIIAGHFILTGSSKENLLFYILLTTVTVMSSAMLVILSVISWKRGLKLPTVFFILYLLFLLGMNVMARDPGSSIALEWGKQIINSIGSLVFAFAAWRFWKSE